DFRAARVRRPGGRRGQGARRERPAGGCDRADRPRTAAAGERAPDRRLPAASPERPRLAGLTSSMRPLRSPPLAGLPSDLLCVLGAGAGVQAPLEPAELALELAP